MPCRSGATHSAGLIAPEQGVHRSAPAETPSGGKQLGHDVTEGPVRHLL